MPLASISLDLDNQWSYMKTHGDKGWEDFPSYFDIFIPFVLEVLDRLKLKITFFVVGKDASLEKNHDYLALINKRGHEVGNHSFNHEPWLHLYTKEQLKKEVLDSAEHINKVSGLSPVGFRGPGFSWSNTLIELLHEIGYLYDATLFPTFIGPIARLYYFGKSRLSRDEKQERNELFGTFKEGFRSVKPFYWKIDSEKELLEIPVTTMPFFKIPFHLSYLIYLSKYSNKLMRLYLKIALSLCKLTKTEPSFLLHPPDILGGDKVPELKFFPGMDLDSERKLEVFEEVLNELRNHFKLVQMSTYARAMMKIEKIKSFDLP
jgi:hypothetical protein